MIVDQHIGGKAPIMTKQLMSSRRQFLQAIGIGAGVVGIGPPTAGLLPSVPQANHGWIAVHENGDADFMVKFSDNIQYWFSIPGINQGTIESRAKIKDHRTGDTITPFDITETTVEFAPKFKENRTITGTIDPFATSENGNIFTNDYYPASRQDIQKALPDILPTGFLASGIFPDEEPYLTIQYPDGFVYEYPSKLPEQDEIRTMYRLSTLSETGPTPPEEVSAFKLPDESYDIAIPKITHRNNTALAWSHGMSRLKLQTLANVWQLFSFPFYTQESPLNAAVGVAQGVAAAITIEAVMSVITQPLPDGVTTIGDVRSIGDALEPDFLPRESTVTSTTEDYQSEGPIERAERILGQVWGVVTGTDSDQSTSSSTGGSSGEGPAETNDGGSPQEVFDRAASSFDEEQWLAAALPEARAQNDGDLGEPIRVDKSILNLDPARSGFATMVPLAKNEVVWSHLLASIRDAQKAQQLREVYLHVLEQQAKIAGRIDIRLGNKKAAVGDEQYWQDLYNYGHEISRRLEALTNAQIEAIQANVKPND